MISEAKMHQARKTIYLNRAVKSGGDLNEYGLTLGALCRTGFKRGG